MKYVGARYTIKVYENTVTPGSAEWQSNVNYEPFTLVTYNNGSYLSKKDVPANIGNPAANTQYWAETGAYNGQILNLQNQIGNLANLITSDNSSLVNAINEIKSETNVLSNQVSLFNLNDNSNIIVIGDSWTNGLHATHGLWYWLNQYLPHDAFYHNQENGSGFLAQGVSGHTFKDLLQITEGSITDDDTINRIIVLGGLNDEGLSGVSAAVDDFADYAHATFKNAAITIITVNRSEYGDLNRYDYINTYKATCDEREYMNFYDLTHHLSIRYWYNTSHLDETGYLFCARNIANVLLGGSPTVMNSRLSIGITDSTNTINITGYLYQSPDGAVTLRVPTINVSGTFSLGGLIKALTLNLSTDITGTENIDAPVTVYATDGNGSVLCSGVAKLLASNQLTINWIHSNGSADYSALYIQEFVINFGLAY